MDFIIVVGDRFASFASGKARIYTTSQFSEAAWHGRIAADEPVVVGQGVEHDRFQGIAQMLKRRHEREISLANPEALLDQCDPAHPASVHKHRRENVLISRPVASGGEHYTAFLAIQDSGEMLADHMTGQHIQGIVLTEAARQMLLSTSEHHLLDASMRGQAYFVLDKLDSEFTRFAFPVPTRIEFRVLSQERKPDTSLKVASRIEFVQEDAIVASVRADFRAYLKSYLDAKEASLARAAWAAS